MSDVAKIFRGRIFFSKRDVAAANWDSISGMLCKVSSFLPHLVNGLQSLINPNYDGALARWMLFSSFAAHCCSPGSAQAPEGWV